MTWEDSWKAAYPYIVNKSTGIKLGDYEDAKRKFYAAYGAANPYAGPTGSFGFTAQDWMQGNQPTANDYDAQRQADEWQRGQSEAFFGQLTPAQQAEYFQQKQEKQAREKKMGQLAALAAFGGVAGAGMLGAGMLGGAMSPAAAAGGDLGMAGWMGSGAGAMGTEVGAAGLAGGAGTGAGAMSGEYLGPLLDSLSSAGAGGGGWAGGMPAGVDLGALGGVMPTGGGGGMLDLLTKYGPDVLKFFGQGGGQQGNQQGPSLGNVLGMGGLGLLSQYYNNSKMPGVPNFMDLAMKTGVSANPNQTNAQGDTLNWAVDPVTGQRTQTVKYGAGNQKAFDEQQAMAQALRSKIMSRPASPPPMQQVDLSNLWG